MKKQPQLYWHFADTDKNGVPHLRYKDKREVIVGETLAVDEVERPIARCEWGLHASLFAIDALKYGSSMNNPFLCRVRLHGRVLKQGKTGDKAVATKRTVIAMLAPDKVRSILRQFVRQQLLEHLDLWPEAPAQVRDFLKLDPSDPTGRFELARETAIYEIREIYRGCSLTYLERNLINAFLDYAERATPHLNHLRYTLDYLVGAHLAHREAQAKKFFTGPQEERIIRDYRRTLDAKLAPLFLEAIGDTHAAQ